MSTNIPNIFEEAMSLPDGDRASLVHLLLHSLQPPNIISENSISLEDELAKRLEDYDSGQSQASDIKDVAVRVQQAIKKRNAQ